jgi:hypothetical protein
VAHGRRSHRGRRRHAGPRRGRPVAGARAPRARGTS